MITYPSLAQLSAWLTLFCFPQMQTVSMPCGCHPYLRAMVSQKVPLCKAKPCSSKGRTVSHTDVPFSCASPAAFFMVRGSCSQTSTAILTFWLLFFSFMNFLASSCFGSIIPSFLPLFLIASFRGWLMALDVVCSWSAISGKMSIPSPPSQAGKAKSFLSMSLMLLLPTMAGITLCLIISSIGCSISLMFAVVLDRYVGPSVLETLIQCTLCGLWLTHCNVCQLLQFSFPLLYFHSDISRFEIING